MFKFLEWIMEAMGWLRIVASPLIIGIGAGAFIYFPQPSATRLTLAIVVAMLGLIIGIVWANRVWKKRGTINFLSRTMATPELDNLVKGEEDSKKPSDQTS